MALIGADFTIRARVADQLAAATGVALSASSAVSRHLGTDHANYVAASSIDGQRRIFAVRKISGYPLYVTVNTSVDTALADWRANRDTTLALTALLDLVVVAAAAGLAAGLRRLEKANACPTSTAARGWAWRSRARWRA